MMDFTEFNPLWNLAVAIEAGTPEKLKCFAVLGLAIGALCAFVVMLSSSVSVLMKYRSWSYQRQNAEDAKRKKFELQAPLEALYDALKQKHWLPAHRDSNRRQSCYWALVFGYSASILWAFVFLVGAVVFYPHSKEFLVFVAWFELFCFISMFLLYLSSGAVNRRWIWTRARAELLRQASIIAVLSQRSTSETAPEGDAPRSSVFDRLRKEVERCLSAARESMEQAEQKVRSEEVLDEAIEAYRAGDIFRKALEEVEGGREDDENLVSAATFYYFRRIARQASWFRVSEHRVEKSQERRERLLWVLFVLGSLAVLGKVCMYSQLIPYHSLGSSVLSSTLLLITAVAGCATASSLNSNSRSLVHRYRMQRRVIAKLERGLGIDNPESQREEALRMLSVVARFEDLMIVELEEWIAITASDRLELAP